MKELKGAPGTWKVKEVDDDEISEMSSTMVVAGSLVIACVGPTGNTDLKSDIDNANLIAAAPDLLESLQNMVTAYEYEASIDNPALLAARAAISKAVGEE